MIEKSTNPHAACVIPLFRGSWIGDWPTKVWVLYPHQVISLTPSKKKLYGEPDERNVIDLSYAKEKKSIESIDQLTYG